MSDAYEFLRGVPRPGVADEDQGQNSILFFVFFRDLGTIFAAPFDVAQT